MFEIFSPRPIELEAPPFDTEALIERISVALEQSGITADTRTHSALLKMLSDDLRWYFESVADAESLET